MMAALEPLLPELRLIVQIQVQVRIEVKSHRL